MTNDEPLFTRTSIDIAASPARVWQTLVDPELTKQYMFGCRALSDWKVGSPLLWEGEMDGAPTVFVKGEVVAFEPPHRLAYTVIGVGAASMGVEDRPENYLTCTCTLTAQGGGTHLEIAQGDYAKVQNGRARYEHSANDEGSRALMEKIKSVAES